MSFQLSQFLDLPFPEKLKLVEDLWDHIAASDELLPVPDWQKEELDRRHRNFEANPNSTVSWQDAKLRIRSKDA